MGDEWSISYGVRGKELSMLYNMCKSSENWGTINYERKKKSKS